MEVLPGAKGTEKRIRSSLSLGPNTNMSFTVCKVLSCPLPDFQQGQAGVGPFQSWGSGFQGRHLAARAKEAGSGDHRRLGRKDEQELIKETEAGVKKHVPGGWM